MFRRGNRIQNGLELTRQSWAALRANPQLLIFPVISLIGMIIVTILFFIPITATGILSSIGEQGRRGSGDINQGLFFIVMFFYYFVTYTVIIFSNTALVGAAMRLARGETATVRDGINIAMARISKIVVYALISATIGMIAKSIQQSGRNSNNIVAAIVSSIIAGIIQGAWNMVVFFAIPVLVVEDIGVMDSLKRSLGLFKETWGETFTGNFAIGAVSCLVSALMTVVAVVLIGLAIASKSVALIVLTVVVVVLAFVAISLINGAINGIFQASLYQYATTGDAGKLIDTQLAHDAFLTTG
ncbi:MAG: DUF6159 family protein [Chloroflexi bacterium]|nr:DUF6159 family protein [Chloroflexota bacterium]MCC6892875.1 hypothetical protein [Anaerolineae bacterium]